jgi:hypothetical protein
LSLNVEFFTSASSATTRPGTRDRFGNQRRQVDAGRGRDELLLQFGERAIELVALLERLSVPAVLAFDKRDAFALDRFRQDHRRTAFGSLRLGERIEDRGHVVSVDDDRVPAERTPTGGQRLHVVPPHRRPALAERVDVGDAAQVVEAVARGGISRFPHRAFGGFAVAKQRVGAIVGLDAPRVQRDANGGANALAQRAGGDVDERKPRRRMTFEIRVDLSEIHQLGSIERASLRPGRVQNRRRVPLRQHEAIGVRVVGIVRIESHLREKQRGHDVGG